jgi:SPP1 family phage portal protein
MNFDLNIAQKLKQRYSTSQSTFRKMYDYYIGKSDIDRTYTKTDRSNKVVHVPYIRKFITEHISYGLNNAITYTSATDNAECIKDIEYNVAIQKGSLDSELYKNMLIFGEAYELAYVYKDELRFRTVTPLNGIPLCNTEEEVEMFLYFYAKELDDTNKIYCDCYCNEAIYHFDDNFSEIESPTPLYFGCVPVSIARLGNGINETLYNDISNLCDGYESVLSDWINNSSDLRDAYLLLTGLELDDEIAKEIRGKGIIQIPSSDGKAEFLIKNIPSDFIKNLADTLEDKIYQISQSVNMNEAMQSNTSSVAILSRVINLRNRIGTEQKALKDAISNRLKLLFTYLNIAENKNYDYRDIKISMTMSVPQDDTAIANAISQLSGKLSIETGLNQLSFIQNGRKEFEKMLAEQKEITKAQTEDMPDLDKVGGTDEAN